MHCSFDTLQTPQPEKQEYIQCWNVIEIIRLKKNQPTEHCSISE